MSDDQHLCGSRDSLQPLPTQEEIKMCCENVAVGGTYTSDNMGTCTKDGKTIILDIQKDLFGRPHYSVASIPQVTQDNREKL